VRVLSTENVDHDQTFDARIHSKALTVSLARAVNPMPTSIAGHLARRTNRMRQLRSPTGRVARIEKYHCQKLRCTRNITVHTFSSLSV
jgi:hypothetical protein